MERREVVNGTNEYDQPGEWTFSRPDIETIRQGAPTQFPSAQTPIGQTSTGQSNSASFATAQTGSRAACLYLGPAGERCYRPALDNGFCPRHQLNASPEALRDEGRARKKKAVATAGIIAVLWPVIEEVVKQLLRLLR